MSTEREYTAAECNATIADLIREHNVVGAIEVLRYMAVRHPEEAEVTYQTMLLGISLGGAS